MLQSILYLEPRAGSRDSASPTAITVADHAEAKRYRYLQRFKEGSDKCWESHSIYKVPSWTRDLNPTAYDPRVVSIGPFHNGKEHLEPMEVHKHRALNHFLLRADGWGREDVVRHFADDKMMRRLRASYAASLDGVWSDDEAFAALMVLDGCFLLELLLANCVSMLCDNPEADGCYARDDPIFNADLKTRRGIVPYIRVDLLGIENQLPLFVLKELADIAKLDVDINWLVRNLYDTNIPLPRPAAVVPAEAPGLHILDVYRKSRIAIGTYSGWTAPFGAQDLSHRGISITCSPSGRAGTFKDISFHEKPAKSIPRSVYDHFMGPLTDRRPEGSPGLLRRIFRFLPIPPSLLCRVPFSSGTAEWYLSSVLLWIFHWILTCFCLLAFWWYVPLWVVQAELTVPTIAFDESTEAILLNMMAFETLHLGRSLDMAVTCYALLMRSVLRSKEDVRLLKRRKVLTCLPERSDKMVVEMLERVTKGVVVDDWNGVGKLNEEMVGVCFRKPNRGWASWKRHYWKDGGGFRSKVTTMLAVYGFIFTLLSIAISFLTYRVQDRKARNCKSG